MDEFTEQYRHFAALLSGPMLKQGTLHQRSPGKWRLRWRETSADGRQMQRTRTISTEDLPVVQELMQELGKIRQAMRDQRRQAKEYVRIYRAERRLVWEQARGGRGSKRDAVLFYDRLVRMVREIKPALRQATLTMVKPRPLGRPRKKPASAFSF